MSGEISWRRLSGLLTIFKTGLGQTDCVWMLDTKRHLILIFVAKTMQTPTYFDHSALALAGIQEKKIIRPGHANVKLLVGANEVVEVVVETSNTCIVNCQSRMRFN